MVTSPPRPHPPAAAAPGPSLSHKDVGEVQQKNLSLWERSARMRRVRDWQYMLMIKNKHCRAD